MTSALRIWKSAWHLPREGRECKRQHHSSPELFWSLKPVISFLEWLTGLWSYNVKGLVRGDYTGLSVGPSLIIWVLERGRGRQKTRSDTGLKTGESRCTNRSQSTTAVCEDGRRGHEPRNAIGSQIWEQPSADSQQENRAAGPPLPRKEFCQQPKSTGSGLCLTDSRREHSPADTWH